MVCRAENYKYKRSVYNINCTTRKKKKKKAFKQYLYNLNI